VGCVRVRRERKTEEQRQSGCQIDLIGGANAAVCATELDNSPQKKKKKTKQNKKSQFEEDNSSFNSS
jgi:hypothetical protein